MFCLREKMNMKQLSPAFMLLPLVEAFSELSLSLEMRNQCFLSSAH